MKLIIAIIIVYLLAVVYGTTWNPFSWGSDLRYWFVCGEATVLLMYLLWTEIKL